MMIVIFLVCSFPYQISKAQVMAPDGTYVGIFVGIMKIQKT